MTNSYFDWSAASRFLRFDTARAEDLNAALDLATAGFDKLPVPAAVHGGAANFAVDSGAANALVVSVAPTHLTSYFDGLSLTVQAAAANTTATAINLNGLGQKSIVRPDGTDLQAGDIVAGQVIRVTYVASAGKFQLAAPPVAGTTGPAGASAYSGRRALAADYAVTAATNRGEMLECTADLTLTMPSGAAAGQTFHCFVAAVAATATISASDGLTNWKMYPGEVRLFYSDGITLRSKVLASFRLTPAASLSFIEPPGYSGYDVFIQAPGGGGGAGRRGAAGATRTGGAGGSAGAWVASFVLAQTPGAAIAVTVGAPGSGGAAQALNDTNGAAGTAGGSSSFGAYVVATGGNGGAGGTNGSGAQAGGAATVSAATLSAGGTAGGNGAAGTVTPAQTGGAATGWAATGGGGGGSVTTSDTYASVGAAAGGASGTDTSSTQLAGGTAGANAGGSGGAGNAPGTTAVQRRGGTGGGGGGGHASLAGGAGGAGARGGGGGGGGAGTNGSTSGAGGAGGAGYIEIIGRA